MSEKLPAAVRSATQGQGFDSREEWTFFGFSSGIMLHYCKNLFNAQWRLGALSSGNHTNERILDVFTLEI